MVTAVIFSLGLDLLKRLSEGKALFYESSWATEKPRPKTFSGRRPWLFRVQEQHVNFGVAKQDGVMAIRNKLHANRLHVN